MNPKSNTLFHFTKSRETLKKILKNGFWPRYCLEDVRWLGYDEHDFVAYPMVCFCDIPLSRISDHVGFYGEFGIGLTKQWAQTNGLNPVFYVSEGNNVSLSFNELSKHTAKLQTGKQQEESYLTTRYLLAHSKPTEGRMVIDGQPVEKMFYQESEWRYVPKHEKIESYLKKSQFDDIPTLESANKGTKKHCVIGFGPKDIRYLFVKSDADIPDIVTFIQGELDHFTGADQKILMSRVVSLESLSSDL